MEIILCGQCCKLWWGCNEHTVIACVYVCVAGEPGFYQTVLSLCGVLSQYLLSLSKLPSSLHIPKDRETLITTFSTLAIEVRLMHPSQIKWFYGEHSSSWPIWIIWWQMPISWRAGWPTANTKLIQAYMVS